VLPFQKVNKVVCEKYFVWHTSCQNDETVTLPATGRRGEGITVNFRLLGFASISWVL